jgi:hypothetical protein
MHGITLTIAKFKGLMQIGFAFYNGFEQHN